MALFWIGRIMNLKWMPRSILQQGILWLALLAGVAAAGPNVQLTKNCPGMRYLGRNAAFQITVANTGDEAAMDVVVTDPIAAGLQFISADNGGSMQGSNLQWRLGTLGPGQTKALAAEFRTTTIGQFKNAATVTYCAQSVKECSFEVKGIPAILLECVDDPDPNEVGQSMTYTITVTNQGSAVDSNITINCTLSDIQEFVSATGASPGTANGKNITFAPLASLAPQTKAVYKVTVKGTGEGDTRFKIEMKSANLTTPVMETEATRFYK